MGNATWVRVPQSHRNVEFNSIWRVVSLSYAVESCEMLNLSRVICCRSHDTSQCRRPRVCLNMLLRRRRRQSWQRKHQSGTSQSQHLRLQWTVMLTMQSRQLIRSSHLQLTPRTCLPSFSQCNTQTSRTFRVLNLRRCIWLLVSVSCDSLHAYVELRTKRWLLTKCSVHHSLQLSWL